MSASDLLLWTAAAILALATLTAAIGLIYLTVLVATELVYRRGTRRTRRPGRRRRQ